MWVRPPYSLPRGYLHPGGRVRASRGEGQQRDLQQGHAGSDPEAKDRAAGYLGPAGSLDVQSLGTSHPAPPSLLSSLHCPLSFPLSYCSLFSNSASESLCLCFCDISLCLQSPFASMSVLPSPSSFHPLYPLPHSWRLGPLRWAWAAARDVGALGFSYPRGLPCWMLEVAAGRGSEGEGGGSQTLPPSHWEYCITHAESCTNLG